MPVVHQRLVWDDATFRQTRVACQTLTAACSWDVPCLRVTLPTTAPYWSLVLTHLPREQLENALFRSSPPLQSTITRLSGLSFQMPCFDLFIHFVRCSLHLSQTFSSKRFSPAFHLFNVTTPRFAIFLTWRVYYVQLLKRHHSRSRTNWTSDTDSNIKINTSTSLVSAEFDFNSDHFRTPLSSQRILIIWLMAHHFISISRAFQPSSFRPPLDVMIYQFHQLWDSRPLCVFLELWHISLQQMTNDIHLHWVQTKLGEYCDSPFHEAVSKATLSETLCSWDSSCFSNTKL